MLALKPPKPDTAYPYQKRTACKSTYTPGMTLCCLQGTTAQEVQHQEQGVHVREGHRQRGQ